MEDLRVHHRDDGVFFAGYEARGCREVVDVGDIGGGKDSGVGLVVIQFVEVRP